MRDIRFDQKVVTARAATSIAEYIVTVEPLDGVLVDDESLFSPVYSFWKASFCGCDPVGRSF